MNYFWLKVVKWVLHDNRKYRSNITKMCLDSIHFLFFCLHLILFNKKLLDFYCVTNVDYVFSSFILSCIMFTIRSKTRVKEVLFITCFLELNIFIFCLFTFYHTFEHYAVLFSSTFSKLINLIQFNCFFSVEWEKSV